MERIPAIVVVVLIAAAAQLASAGFPNQYWPAPAPATPAPSGPSTGFPTSGWQDAHATFYGDDSGLGHDFGTYTSILHAYIYLHAPLHRKVLYVSVQN
jgi:hypothetical protein